MNRTDKQFLHALAATPCGETTEQVTTPTGGKAPDAGARKASAMHAANAGRIDGQVRKASDRKAKREERKARIAAAA